MDSIGNYDWSAFPTHLNIPATRSNGGKLIDDAVQCNYQRRPEAQTPA
jgi:hypothetical protein